MLQIGDLGDRRREEFFDACGVEEYLRRLDAIWQRHVFAHTSWRALQAVRSFPADMLLGPDEQVFLRLVELNFSSQIALDVINVLTDTDKKALTFHRLRGWMVENCCDELRDALRAHLEGLVPDKDLTALLDRCRAVRDRVLAHHDRRTLVEGHLTISYDEIQGLLDESERLLNALSIGSHRMMLPPEYFPYEQRPGQPPHRIDIERFLVQIAKGSAVLNMPEEDPCMWQLWLDAGHINDPELFNAWRRNVSLPEIAIGGC